ncbi:hypothetical protein N7535_009585 [Penicillium sp. DV-2018c]|nr:hypothetical protein N7461_002070 [Penicillium sp. DV-2018c]KAJ5559357.1 hypothetical protein N7535_009585 [Penicillium sp. DV-2018c]
MSPAVISEMQPDLHRDQLEAVGTALDALLLTVYRLTHRQNELFQHLDDVYKQYSEVIDILPPQDRPHALDIQSKLLAQKEEYRQGLVHSKPPVEEQLLNPADVIKTLLAHQNVDEITFSAIKKGIKGCKSLLRSQDDLSQISSNSCILGQAPAPAIALEKDFTTNGTQGNLHCPFSKPNNMQTETGSEASRGQNSATKIRRESTCGHENLDPVKAELDERSSRVPSAPSSKGACPVSRCPIRFLDQHSPEEIAEYVERHKHEIPRSHAICVKRYQRNPQDMRQLDAKYGGLTSMIAGLGVKHQAFLPDRQTSDQGHSSTSASTQRVEKWAENVDPITPEADLEEEKGDHNNDEDRQGRFDRPLREVRVGESPSRPWGISVPVTDLPPISEPPTDPTSVPTSPEPQTDKPSAEPAGRCPFGHDKPKPDVPNQGLEKPSSTERIQAEKAATPDKPGCPFGHTIPKAEATKPPPPWMSKKTTAIGGGATPDITLNPTTAPVREDPTTNPSLQSALSNASHVTFSGPVFFGYSAEETAKLLQQLGNSSK